MENLYRHTNWDSTSKSCSAVVSTVLSVIVVPVNVPRSVLLAARPVKVTTSSTSVPKSETSLPSTVPVTVMLPVTSTLFPAVKRPVSSTITSPADPSTTKSSPPLV